MRYEGLSLWLEKTEENRGGPRVRRAGSVDGVDGVESMYKEERVEGTSPGSSEVGLVDLTGGVVSRTHLRYTVLRWRIR